MRTNPRRVVADESDLELMAEESARQLAELSRPSALRAACDRCSLGWVRKAHREGTLEAKCLGRFDLVGAAAPWPSVMFLVSDPGAPGRSPRLAAIALYVSPEGRWEVSDREPVRGKLAIDWRQYAGDHDGTPGVVNGDDATGTGPATVVSRARPPSDDPAPLPDTFDEAAPARPAGAVRRRPAARRKPSRGTRRPPDTSAGTSRADLLLALLRFLGPDQPR